IRIFSSFTTSVTSGLLTSSRNCSRTADAAIHFRPAWGMRIRNAGLAQVTGTLSRKNRSACKIGAQAVLGLLPEAGPLAARPFALPGRESQITLPVETGSTLRIHIPQRAVVVGEIAGIEDLQAGIVLTIEEGRCGGTSSTRGCLRRPKPQSEMIHLNRIEG